MRSTGATADPATSLAVMSPQEQTELLVTTHAGAHTLVGSQDRSKVLTHRLATERQQLGAGPVDGIYPGHLLSPGGRVHGEALGPGVDHPAVVHLPLSVTQHPHTHILGR